MVYYKGALSYETLCNMPRSYIVKHINYAKKINAEIERAMKKS